MGLVFFLCRGRRKPQLFFFFQAEDGIRDPLVTGVQTCALPICGPADVGDLGEHLSARGLPDLVRRLVEVLFAARADSYPRALGGQLLRRGPAEPVAAPRDDSDLTVQTKIE